MTALFGPSLKASFLGTLTMVTTGTHEHGDMKRLLERWRTDPKALREAIRSARETYQRTPKAAPRLPDATCLVGESKGGNVLYGIVVADIAMAGDVYAELQATAAHVKKHYRRREARIQVFVPLDWPHETPTSIAGVRVDWFRWVPASEDELQVDKFTAGSGANTAIELPGDSVITRLLGHLAWWNNTITAGTSSERAARQLLLVNNAAALLEWHLTVLGNAPPARLTATSTRTAAAKLARGFADTLQEAVARARKPDGSLGERRAAKALLALPGALQKLLKQMERLLAVQVSPGRVMEFEEPLKPAKLIREAGATFEQPDARLGSPRHTLTGPGVLVLESLLPAIAAERLADNGELSREALVAVRQACAGWLQDAIEIAARESKGAERKRWRKVGEPVVEAWQRGGDPGAQEAGA